MKNYKNYLKKLEQAYAHQKLKDTEHTAPQLIQSQKISAPSNNAFLDVSTPLPTAYLHYLFMLILAIAAIYLIYQINIPAVLALTISILIVLNSTYILLKDIRGRQSIQNLQCFNHTWFLLYTDGTREKLDIQSISRGLGMLYVLYFVSQEKKNAINLCIWKYQSPKEFLAYCAQLILIGKKN